MSKLLGITMRTLEVHSLFQGQALSEATIFQTIPKDIVSHIVNEVINSDNRGNLVSEALKEIEKYKETGLISVMKDITLRWTVEGSEKKSLIPDGFKINSVERVLVYLSIFAALASFLAKDPEETIEFNQTFIESCENCYIEIRGSK